MLKKLTVISLFFIYLFGATGASQLLKLPVLIQHFVEHKEDSPNISFLAFLKIHYAVPFIMDADVQRDLELPFKSLENHSFLALSNILPTKIEIELEASELPPIHYPVIESQFVQMLSAFDFFQPPRLV